MELVPYNKYVKGKDRPANYILQRSGGGGQQCFLPIVFI